ncbi:MAG: glycine cleavage system aminomethyltransferase GcvT [Peptococcaceae bacterium]
MERKLEVKQAVVQRTPLYEEHLKAGGKIVEFGGFAMPVQYKGIIEEHNTVRNQAGLFDVSHMGEFEVKGADAGRFIQRLITNDLNKIEPNKVIYSPMCYEDGGTVDDLLVYCFAWNHFWLVVNAANIAKDWTWVVSQIKDEAVEIKNISPDIAQVALQGPKAEDILQQITSVNLSDLKSFRFTKITIAGQECLVSRTGYTGEDGFEIYLEAGQIARLWQDLLEKGRCQGLAPIGLGARDTLRFEAGLPLYGHELSSAITPLEAGLGMFVALNGEADFIGKAALGRQKAAGLKRKKVGIEMVARGIPREGYDIVKAEKEIGFITSGSFSPSTGKNLGMALIESSAAQIGAKVDVVIRNKPCEARIIHTPFFKNK